MKKQLMSSLMAASLFVFGLSSTVFAANESAEVKGSKEPPVYTSDINGQDKKGKWTILFDEGLTGISGELQEKCGSSWEYADFLEVNITSGVSSKSSTYYMKSKCKYRVKLTVGNNVGKAWIRNWE